MSRHEKATTSAGTTSDQARATVQAQAARAATRARWARVQGLLCIPSLVAVVVLIGNYELRAGQHAQFGTLAWAVPLVLGPYVLWTWTDPHTRWWDEVGAVVLLVTSVGLSVLSPPPAAQAFGIGLVLIAVEWRMVARWRAGVRRRDELAAVVGVLAGVAHDLEETRAAEERRILEDQAAFDRALAAWRAKVDEERTGRVAAEEAAAGLRRELAAARAAGPATAVAADGGKSGGSAAARPWGSTVDSQVAWLRDRIGEGGRFTGETVAELMGLGSAKTGRDRLAAARKPHAVPDRDEAVGA